MAVADTPVDTVVAGILVDMPVVDTLVDTTVADTPVDMAAKLVVDIPADMAAKAVADTLAGTVLAVADTFVADYSTADFYYQTGTLLVAVHTFVADFHYQADIVVTCDCYPFVENINYE